MHTHIQAHTLAHTCSQAHTQTSTHTQAHTHLHAYTHTGTHMHSHTYAHTHMYAHAHTHTHAYIHTHNLCKANGSDHKGLCCRIRGCSRSGFSSERLYEKFMFLLKFNRMKHEDDRRAYLTTGGILNEKAHFQSSRSKVVIWRQPKRLLCVLASHTAVHMDMKLNLKRQQFAVNTTDKTMTTLRFTFHLSDSL